jgi:hypothetical protein
LFFHTFAQNLELPLPIGGLESVKRKNNNNNKTRKAEKKITSFAVNVLNIYFFANDSGKIS